MDTYHWNGSVPRKSEMRPNMERYTITSLKESPLGSPALGLKFHLCMKPFDNHRGREGKLNGKPPEREKNDARLFPKKQAEEPNK